jgi:hypothetical protein
VELGLRHQHVRCIHEVEVGASALVYAWASGKLLNIAKAKLGRGDFGAWRKEHLGDDIAERTSQRYMRLAKECDDVNVTGMEPEPQAGLYRLRNPTGAPGT